jgi:hypothetical protein
MVKVNITSLEGNMQLWHHKFGHLYYAGLQYLSSTTQVRELPIFIRDLTNHENAYF